MSGTKHYDRSELLDRAVELFRVRGYSDTSTAALVDELGVNRKSMYAEFGSKQGLFEAALEHYDRENLSRVLGPLEAPDAGLDTIRRAFRGYGQAAEGWPSGRGCLMCNTAVERAALDPGARAHVDRYLQRIEAAFVNALRNGRATGELNDTVDVHELGAFFAMSMVGVSALLRAQAPPAQVQAACRVVITMLDHQSCQRPV